MFFFEVNIVLHRNQQYYKHIAMACNTRDHNRLTGDSYFLLWDYAYTESPGAIEEKPPSVPTKTIAGHLAPNLSP